MGRTFLVVSHSHWDREWYRTAEQFRARLLPLVDEVLRRPGPFLLDGQGIVLDDYLAWRPERRAQLGDRLRAGGLEAGPWLVLADNLIPSGEALVRNLLAGREALGRAGGTPLPVLYCPDTFGHPAAGPTLAAGFGLPLAIVWRGYGGRGWPPGDAARWRSAAGDEVQLYHLPPSGYEHGASLPTDPALARERWREMSQTLGARAGDRPMLVLNGADHHAPQAELDEAVTCARAVLPDATIGLATLGAFAEARRAHAAAMPLPLVMGELRWSPGHAWSLGGTLGTRAGQKRRNAQLERALVHDVEPWVALAWWHRGTDLSAQERATWRLVLENHPHDTLCGCSIDAVARAMDDRLERAGGSAEEVRRQALHAIAGVDGDASRAAWGDHARALIVTNPVPYERCGVVEVEVDLPLAMVAVGPGSATDGAPPRPAPPLTVGEPALAMQRLGARRTIVWHESAHHYPRAVLVQRTRVLVWVPELPPMGMLTLAVHERRSRPRAPHAVSALGGTLSNGRLRVYHDEERGLCCESDAGTMPDLLGFECVGDRGDLYTHAAVPGTLAAQARCRSARVTMRGPLRAELTLRFDVPVPARALASAAGEATSHGAAVHRVQVRVQLDAGAEWFRLVVDGENHAADQRLRLVVRTGAPGRTHWADAAMGEVTRSSMPVERSAGDVEVSPGTAPLHRHVTCVGEATSRGATVFSDGLAEYEATPSGDIAITLVRSVGELSRADLSERPGHAGWPAETPGAQCLGAWQAVFAILPHGPRTPATLHRIARVGDEVLLPACGTTIVSHPVTSVVGPLLEGEHLASLACKRSLDGTALVVRCHNRTSQPAGGAWHLPGLRGAALARLDETPLGDLPVREDRVRFMVPPHAVSTILLRRE